MALNDGQFKPLPVAPGAVSSGGLAAKPCSIYGSSRLEETPPDPALVG